MCQGQEKDMGQKQEEMERARKELQEWKEKKGGLWLEEEIQQQEKGKIESLNEFQLSSS